MDSKSIKTLFFIIILFYFLLLQSNISFSERIELVENHTEKIKAIGGISNWNKSTETQEICYAKERQIHNINSKNKSNKIFTLSSDAYGEGISDIECSYNWDYDDDLDILWSDWKNVRTGIKMRDFLGNKKTWFYNKLANAKYTDGSYRGHLTYGKLNESKGIFYYIERFDHNNNYHTSNLIFIPHGNYSFKKIWKPPKRPTDDLLVSDINNDNSSEFISIQKDKNIVWYNFYNSTGNILKNAIDLMDETYDIDKDGLKEIFYITAHKPNKIAWTDINGDGLVTDVNAIKLGGTGQWDNDSFNEISYVDRNNNIKVFEIYRISVKKKVQSIMGLGENIAVNIEIYNNRNRSAFNISLEDTLPKDFNPIYNGPLRVNLTKENKTETIETPFKLKDEGWGLHVNNYNTKLLEELGSNKKIKIRYRVKTPTKPGTYKLDGAKVYWKDRL